MKGGALLLKKYSKIIEKKHNKKNIIIKYAIASLILGLVIIHLLYLIVINYDISQQALNSKYNNLKASFTNIFFYKYNIEHKYINTLLTKDKSKIIYKEVDIYNNQCPYNTKLSSNIIINQSDYILNNFNNQKFKQLDFLKNKNIKFVKAVKFKDKLLRYLKILILHLNNFYYLHLEKFSKIKSTKLSNKKNLDNIICINNGKAVFKINSTLNKNYNYISFDILKNTIITENIILSIELLELISVENLHILNYKQLNYVNITKLNNNIKIYNKTFKVSIYKIFKNKKIKRLYKYKLENIKYLLEFNLKYKLPIKLCFKDTKLFN